jgi:O-antigen/teichoic acid export membrane protein
VTPVIVGALGPALFGAWEMLLRLTSYVSATDGRPTESLRLVLAQEQGNPDTHAKRRLVGAALVVWALLAPVVLALGTVLVLAAPPRIGSAADLGGLQLAAICLVGSLLLGSLAAVPESVLRGVNLGHTRLRIQTALHVIGGAMLAAAAWVGLGVAGLGGATLVRAALTVIAFLALVRAQVRWFGVDRPARKETTRLLRMSGWLTAGDVIARLVLASDILILGFLLGPEVVALYVLTSYAARAGVGIHVFTAGEALPGLGGLLGSAEYGRVRRARREILLLTWLYTTVAGTTILAWNRSFVGLWVGPELYAGRIVDLLLVLIAVQTAFIRVDSGMIDAALRPRERVQVGAVAAVVSLILATLGAMHFGVAGLAGGVLLGRAVQSVGYPVLVARLLRGDRDDPPADQRTHPQTRPRLEWSPAVRGLAATATLFALAAWFGAAYTDAGWLQFIVGVGITAPAALVLAFQCGATSDGRVALRSRVRSLLAGRWG